MNVLDNIIFHYRYIFYFSLFLIQFLRVLWNNELLINDGWEDVENSQAINNDLSENDIFAKMLLFYTFFWKENEDDIYRIKNLKQKVNMLSKLTIVLFPIVLFILLYNYQLDFLYPSLKIDLLFFIK